MMADMQKMYVVMWVGLAAVVVAPILFRLRARDMYKGFNELLTERHFAARSEPPIKLFTGKDPPIGLHWYAGYDGNLGPNTPLSLLMLRRTEFVNVNGAQVQTSVTYLGAYVPPAVKTDGTWRKAWEDKAARKKEDIAYAASVPEGGFVIVWQGSLARSNVEKRLAQVAASLGGGGS
jgi:hypothetical protein